MKTVCVLNMVAGCLCVVFFFFLFFFFDRLCLLLVDASVAITEPWHIHTLNNWRFLFLLILFFALTSHYHLSLNREGRWGTTDDFATSFRYFSLFFTALWDLPNSRPVHSLMLSSHLFFCLPCLLPSFTVPCKVVLARPDERETWPYHCSLRLFTIVRRSSGGPVACWILAQTSSLVTWSFFLFYEICSILR